MKFHLDRKKISFYLKLALAFYILNLIGSLIDTPEIFFQRAVNHLWLLIFLLPLNYILFEYTIPYIRFNWKRILAGIFFIWVHAMLYSFGLNAWRNLGVQLHVYFDLKTFKAYGGESYFMAYSVASVVFFALVTHVYNYITLKNAAKQLQIEKQQAELNYLKSQTNPHFLFNTLNNIYSLARDKNDLAPESILRLSKILRFMLYETGGTFIAIEQELKIMQDYIALEALRYDENLHINFNHDVEDMKQAVPPLLLVPLVENAFKHGVSESRNHPFVDIHLSIKNKQLQFEVKNSSERNTDETVVKENIGLSNLRRQLELQFKEFSLSAEKGELVFTTVLKINLASHV